ncbi:hypothetical protein ARMGADRAFT_537865 [Armillaria gallica]|uniref:Uncharacterized protein n=1 Tax=Armillaria gallica TaxID=47427 RepID=A0A2H3D469_ARMGA|nr:hypothetical protein ARMGADRAFT_537865 [Armillaria gallica]
MDSKDVVLIMVITVLCDGHNSQPGSTCYITICSKCSRQFAANLPCIARLSRQGRFFLLVSETINSGRNISSSCASTNKYLRGSMLPRTLTLVRE